jgi:hypothetical protein
VKKRESSLASFEAPVPELVRTVPHVAFEVDDLSAEIAGKEILIAPSSGSSGVTVAFIVENGAPVEFSSLIRSDA